MKRILKRICGTFHLAFIFLIFCLLGQFAEPSKTEPGENAPAKLGTTQQRPSWWNSKEGINDKILASWTPVKPVSKDAWDYRIFHVSKGTYDPSIHFNIPGIELDKLTNADVKTIAFHEHWTDIEAYISTAYGSELKKLVKACHKRGLELILYFGMRNGCLIRPIRIM